MVGMAAGSRGPDRDADRRLREHHRRCLSQSATDPDGKIRRYATGMYYEGGCIESLATALTPDRSFEKRHFHRRLRDRLQRAFRAFLSSMCSTGRFGRRPVRGQASRSSASATIWSQDNAVCRAMVSLPITLVQLLAAETVRQDRMLSELGAAPRSCHRSARWVLFCVFLRRRMSLASALRGSLAYVGVSRIHRPGAACHIRGCCSTRRAFMWPRSDFFVAAFWHELDQRHSSLQSALRGSGIRCGASLPASLPTISTASWWSTAITVIRAASRLAEDLISAGYERANSSRTSCPQPFQERIAQGARRRRRRSTASLRKSHHPKRRAAPRIVEFVVTLSSHEEAEVSREFARARRMSDLPRCHRAQDRSRSA